MPSPDDILEMQRYQAQNATHAAHVDALRMARQQSAGIAARLHRLLNTEPADFPWFLETFLAPLIATEEKLLHDTAPSVTDRARSDAAHRLEVLTQVRDLAVQKLAEHQAKAGLT